MRCTPLLISLLCSFAFASTDLLADFHPLGKHPPLEPLHSCTQPPAAAQPEAFTCQLKGHPAHATLLLHDPGVPVLTLDLPTGQRLQPVLRPMPGRLAGLWTADLNRDGQPDYLLNLSWNGNGIEAEASVVLCLLSSASGYRATAFDTMLFDPYAVIRPQQGFPVLLQTALVSAMDRAGVWHSFWVHHFLRVQGDHLVLSERPPVWVQYKLRPDPSPTRLLTAVQKRAAWRAYTTSAEWRGFFIAAPLSPGR